MPTNPFSYKMPTFIGDGNISCHSNSANFQLVIIVLDTNTSIAFSGAGVGTNLQTVGGATSAPIPHSVSHTSITVMFFHTRLLQKCHLH